MDKKCINLLLGRCYLIEAFLWQKMFIFSILLAKNGHGFDVT